MRTKIPERAFDYFVGLGEDRTYKGVATHFNVSERAVVKRAARERWRERLSRIEEAARTEVDARLVVREIERLEKHMEAAIKKQEEAMDAMLNHPIRSAVEAAEIVFISVLLERAILDSWPLATAPSRRRTPRRKARVGAGVRESGP